MQALFVLDNVGSVIIEKPYKGLIARSVVEYFWDEVSKKGSHPSEIPPVIASQKYYYAHIQRADVFFLAIISIDVNPLLYIEMLTHIAEIFVNYYGKLNASALRYNFINVYQLLDEMADAGYPFNLEPNVLQEMISVPNVINQATGMVLGPGTNISSILPDGSLTPIFWRRNGVKYTSNEIYLDIVDEIDAIIEKNGAMTTSKITGKVVVDCQMSGMPDFILRFRNPGILDDVSFHKCVRLSRWEREKVISFIPPDGNFVLMDYRSTGHFPMPINVTPQILFGEGNGTVHIMVATKHVTDRPIEHITITIPFASNVSGTTLTSKNGSVNFDDSTKICTWKMRDLPKETAILDGTFTFSTDLPPIHPVIQVGFTVTMWSASGLKVETLTLLNEKYNHFKGVKSTTRGGHLEIRT